MNFYNDLEFLNSGEVKQTSAMRSKLPFQNYCGVQFVASGNLWLQIGDGEVFTAQAPVVFFTYPGVPFSYGSPPGEKREHMHICFRGERAERYAADRLIGSCAEHIENSSPFITINDPAELRQLFRKALSLLAFPGENHHGRAVLALEEILLFISAQADYEAQTFPEAAEILNLTREISAEPQLDWNFSSEAEKRQLSEVHFRRLFRKFAGLPPGQFLLECRMRLARNLLANTTRRIGEIAADTGFNDMFHFSRIFKKRFGKSPVAYRKKYGL